jgi:hypothetical protein
MLLSVGDQVRPGTYRFHSRFNRAVNFKHEGRLVSVVDETIGPGPLNIVLGDIKLAPAQGHAGSEPSILKGLHNTAQGWIASPVPGDPTLSNRPRKVLNPERFESPISFDTFPPLHISSNTVRFAGCRYPFTARHRYNSTLDLQAVHLRRFQHNLATLGASLREDSPPKSLAFLLDRKRRRNFRAGFERTFAEQIVRGVHQVFHGNLLAGVRQLKGCGLGLTPGGDDFIAGLLIGLHVLQTLRGQDLQPTMDVIFRAAQGDNIFSNTFLDLARRGLLFGRMKDLLLALISGNRASVGRTSAALFAIGASSGADLATGLFMTLEGDVASVMHSAGLKLETIARPSAHPTQRWRRRADR